MTTLFQQMIANGASFDEAARWQHADDLQRFRNRESANYGVYAPDPPSQQEVQEAYSFKYEA